MAWPQALIRLQEIDQTLKAHRARLVEIERALQDTAALQAAEQEAQTRAEAARTARQAQETLEFELSQVQVKRDLTEKALYGGRITNTRELQDLQAELQALTRRIATLEDRLLEAMLASEEADHAAEQARAAFQTLHSESQARQTALEEERSQLQREIAGLQAEREQTVSIIPPSVLDAYRYLYDRTGGMPVARLSGNVCGVCGVELTSPTRRKAQRGEVAYCDGCGRLLVV